MSDTESSKTKNDASDNISKVIGKDCFDYLEKKLKDKQYYEAYSLVCTFVRRCIARAAYGEATHLCHMFARRFIGVERYDLANELGDVMVTAFDTASYPVTEERIQAILDIFTPRPSQLEVARHKFIEHALKWSINQSGPESDDVIRLHRIAGVNYQHEKLYGLAQGHLVFCGDGELLGETVAEWLNEGYASERPLFVLRAVLLLLAKEDITTAETFLFSKALNIDLDDSNVSPAIQLSYLLIEACKTKNSALFDVLTSKYSLVIRRDKLFSECLDLIHKRVLGRESNKKNLTFFSMFSTLLGQGGSQGQPSTNALFNASC